MTSFQIEDEPGATSFPPTSVPLYWVKKRGFDTAVPWALLDRYRLPLNR